MILVFAMTHELYSPNVPKLQSPQIKYTGQIHKTLKQKNFWKNFSPSSPLTSMCISAEMISIGHMANGLVWTSIFLSDALRYILQVHQLRARNGFKGTTFLTLLQPLADLWLPFQLKGKILCYHSNGRSSLPNIKSTKVQRKAKIRILSCLVFHITE